MALRYSFNNPAYHQHELTRTYCPPHLRRPNQNFICGHCSRPSIPPSFFFSCEQCAFKLCLDCSLEMQQQVPNNSVPTFANSHHHPLFKLPAKGIHPYQGGFVCNRCSRPNQSPYRWNCLDCEYDLCEDCFDRCQILQPESCRSSTHLHPLEHVPARGTGGYVYGFRCDLCSQLNPSSTRWTCQRCEYDLCQECFTKARVNPPPPRDDLPPKNIRPHDPIPSQPEAPETPVAPETPMAHVELKNEETQLCVICLDNPKNATLIHEGTGHVCCCLSCAQLLFKGSKPCPICRKRVEMVIQVFFS